MAPAPGPAARRRSCTAIDSIALTRTTVCLGEFGDGELLRLLPKCTHAFHVQCIDTWLRAHVNCPLCHAAVVGPAAAAAEQPDPSTGAGADAEQDAGDTGTAEHEQPGQHANELRVQTDQHGQSGNSPERPHHHPGPRAQTLFRRVASMDSPPPMASSEEASGEEQDGGEKQGTGSAAVCRQVLSPAASAASPKSHRRMKRSLSAGSRWAPVSRQRRSRSSWLLPL